MTGRYLTLSSALLLRLRPRTPQPPPPPSALSGRGSSPRLIWHAIPAPFLCLPSVLCSHRIQTEAWPRDERVDVDGYRILTTVNSAQAALSDCSRYWASIARTPEWYYWLGISDQQQSLYPQGRYPQSDLHLFRAHRYIFLGINTYIRWNLPLGLYGTGVRTQLALGISPPWASSVVSAGCYELLGVGWLVYVVFSDYPPDANSFWGFSLQINGVGSIIYGSVQGDTFEYLIPASSGLVSYVTLNTCCLTAGYLRGPVSSLYLPNIPPP